MMRNSIAGVNARRSGRGATGNEWQWGKLVADRAHRLCSGVSIPLTSATFLLSLASVGSAGLSSAWAIVA